MGFKVELVPFDDQAKPDVGVANAKSTSPTGHPGRHRPSELRGGHPIVRGLQGSEPRDDLAGQHQPTVTDRGYPNVNRVCGRDDVQGWSAASSPTGRSRPRARTSSTTRRRTGRAWQSSSRPTPKEGHQGPRLRGHGGESNFDPIITPLKAKNPDLIYFGGIYEQAAPFFKQAREKGVKGKFLGLNGLDSSDLVKIAGKSVVGMNYTSVAGPVSSSTHKRSSSPTSTRRSSARTPSRSRPRPTTPRPSP